MITTQIKTKIAEVMVRSSRPEPLPEKELERLHLSPETPNFNDSSYFFGADRSGLALATRLAFRTEKPDEAWLEVRLPDAGPHHLAGGPGPRGDGFALGALSFTCEQVGKRWRLRYQGPLEGPDGEVPFELDATFHGRTPVVDFAHHANQRAVAEAMAAQRWTGEFFRKLREVHKVHYEQGGRLVGRAVLGDREIDLDLPSIRDHSFGTRLWSQWDRHIWVLGALDDGSYFNVSMIRFDFLGTLRTGWRWRHGRVLSMVDCDDFEHFGPADQPPSAFSLSFRPRALATETAVVEARDAFDFVLDDDEYRIREWIADMRLGDARGVGVAEFGWNPRRSRG